jgi:hypothetical protein
MPRSTALPSIRVQPSQHRVAVSLPLLGKDIRIHADDVGVLAQRLGLREEVLDRSHERRLPRPRVADEKNVRRRLSHEVLHQRHGDLANGLILSDDGLTQLVEDVLRPERKLHGAGILCGF